MIKRGFLIAYIFVFSFSVQTIVLAKIPRVSMDANILGNHADGEDTAQESIETLLARLDEEPYNPDVYGALAFVFESIGEYEQALWATQKQVAYIPKDAEEKEVYYGNLARAYFLNGKWKEGKEWLDKADAVNPNNYYNRMNAVNYYATFKKDYKNAALQLQKTDLILGGDGDVYYAAYMNVRELAMDPLEIVELFKAAVKQDPKNYRAHRILGMAMRDSAGNDFGKNKDMALEQMQVALKLNPAYIPTYISIGSTYLLFAKFNNVPEAYNSALEWFNKAFEIDPDNPRLAFSMGNLFFSMKEYDKAIEKLEFARELGGNDEATTDMLASVYNSKAYAYYESGKGLSEGMTLIEKALTLKPDDGIYLSTKAELLYKLKRYEEAYGYIKRGLELGPAMDEMIVDLEMIEKALGKEGEYKYQDLESYSTPNEMIKKVEGLLFLKGYNPGFIDGRLDQDFREAVADFQKDNGLKVTWFVDEATLEKLMEK